ncbi:transglutaminase domain-containing protein [Microbacterium sp. Marseille-Q6965]|uniref:transglutaminase domain-containing protein n=1 Tax=Microbacterium sp. Marseille-Q6965 TaxID=2965072 RepID=UPI0021B81E81|nr:transglutaminase domain-containing protein [Microbacterium sp. Marseille-Q6965]
MSATPGAPQAAGSVAWGGADGSVGTRLRELASVEGLVALGWLAAMAALAGFAAWPIYEGAGFVAVVAVGFVVALALAVAARAWRLPGWITALAALGAVIALGVAFAVPGRWASPSPFPGVLTDALQGAVLGWKDLLTVELPVAEYRNLLMPAVVVFVVGPLVSALAALAGRAGLAVAGAVATASFGLLLGHTVASAPLAIGTIQVPAPRELTLGLLALLLSVAWLSWRARNARRRALSQAAERSGVRLRRRSPWSVARRIAVTTALVGVAVAAAGMAAPAAVESRERLVPRAATGPELAIREAVSPLSEYRAAFADDAYEEELFRVSGASLPERIRIASLTAYDGETYRALDPASDAADQLFVRVPSWGGAGGESARIEIGALDGIWLPTFGEVSRIEFSGERASTLADGLYYSDDSAGAVQTAGVEPGTAYTVVAQESWATLAELTSPQRSPGVPIPDSVATWIERNDITPDGAGLENAVSLLRERGYLSHALRLDAEADEPRWMADLGDEYRFRPSESGHSLARIDQLFSDLIEAESTLRESTAAAVGDDEQFAVAASLVAQQLGYPTRVVVGARLEAEEGLPACEDGVCRGSDLAVWLEVQGASGQWAAIDATPQWEEQLDIEEQQLQDPKVPTQVRPDDASEIQPPDPLQQRAQDSDDQGEDASDELLWAVARGVGIGLLAALLALGPFLVVIVAKAVRRSARRGAAAPVQRIEGGWEEYVDAAVDHGLPGPGTRTRAELAELYATPNGAALAAVADRAVFSRGGVGPDEAERFWQIVQEERKALGADRSWWARLVAAVSLRSFLGGTGSSPRGAAGGGDVA